MELDAKTFAIFALVFGIVGALFWDWQADWFQEFRWKKKQEEDYWKKIDQPDDEIDEDKRDQSGKK